MDVIKSDGTREDYSSSKVWDTVCDAFKTAGEPCIPAVIDAIVANLYVYDKVSTSEIRRQVEDGLMSVNKKVAKAYIERYKSDMELKDKDDFIRQYIKASNAATGSKYDPNANVAHKNIVTMGGELYKGNAIRLNRYVMRSKLKALYGKRMANQYIEDIESHVLYKHDETGIPGMPYCVAITMYPFLTDGLVNLGGPSKPPTDLKSFCGEFINLVYSVSSQFLGAVATPEFLLYMDYFIRKDYGDDYINRLVDVVDLSRKRRTLESVIENCFQQVVHSMNMPAGTRGYQSVFWNVGYFDSNYFKGVFEDFVFPDGTKPKWETLSWLQKKFMKWFNEERTKYTLTFPVESIALLTDGEDVIDKEYADFTSEMWAEGHSFFCYLSDSADSLASCCRLRNSLKDLEDTEHNHTVHQYSMGTASVSTGSKSVMTINLNRVVQDSVRKFAHENLNEELANGEQFIPNSPEELDEVLAYISKSVEEITFRVHKYQHAFNEVVKDYLKASMLDVYSAGFIDIKRQYLTVGLNGFTDAAEFLGIDAKPCEEYRKFANSILETINKCNAASRTKELMFNTEFVPAENLSVKNRKWDIRDGYFVSEKHNMYSSYFFNPEDVDLTVIDKMVLHGKDYVQYLDGGSACHINLREHLSKEQYRQLLSVACKDGTNYFTFNVKNTCCEDCGYISKHTLDKCPKCGSTNLSYLTRIIGYLKKVSSFSEPRQIEEGNRAYT